MDVEKVIDKLSELQLIRPSRRIGNYMQIYCPFHNNGEEKKPSCGILLHEEFRNGQRYPAGWLHCFTCGAAKTLPEAITDILKLRSITRSGEDWLKENIEGYESDTEFDSLIPSSLSEAILSKFAVNQLQTLTNPVTYVSEEELASYRFTVPYMYQRKLTDPIIEEYDIGVDMKWTPPGRTKVTPCITFPVRDKAGRTLFICRRSIEGKLYNYPEGVSKPVYGLDRVPPNCKSVIICESCINALTARVYGYNAVALLGTGNQLQVQQLRELGVREFVLCMDGDEAGRKATNKLYRALSSCSIVWRIHMPDGKDLNDCTKEEFDKLYSMKE